MLDGRGWAVSSRRVRGEVVGKKKSRAKVRAVGYFVFYTRIHSGRFLCGVGLPGTDGAGSVAGHPVEKKTDPTCAIRGCVHVA